MFLFVEKVNCVSNESQDILFPVCFAGDALCECCLVKNQRTNVLLIHDVGIHRKEQLLAENNADEAAIVLVAESAGVNGLAIDEYGLSRGNRNVFAVDSEGEMSRRNVDDLEFFVPMGGKERAADIDGIAVDFDIEVLGAVVQGFF